MPLKTSLKIEAPKATTVAPIRTNSNTEFTYIAAPGVVKSSKVTFHFVRHAQAMHNVAPRVGDKKITVQDPKLTEHGLDQCLFTRKTFPYMANIKYVLCSPMDRTITTTLSAFWPVVGEAGITAIAWDDLREFGHGFNNLGTPLQELVTAHWNMPINFDLLSKGWEFNRHDEERDRDQRCLRVRQDLYRLSQVVIQGGAWKGFMFQPHKGFGKVEILVVSHGAFLSRFLGYGREQVFHNTQWRSYKFASLKKQLTQRCSSLDMFEKKRSRQRKHAKLVDPEAPPAPPSTPESPKLLAEITERGGFTCFPPFPERTLSERPIDPPASAAAQLDGIIRIGFRVELPPAPAPPDLSDVIRICYIAEVGDPAMMGNSAPANRPGEVGHGAKVRFADADAEADAKVINSKKAADEAAVSNLAKLDRTINVGQAGNLEEAVLAVGNLAKLNRTTNAGRAVKAEDPPKTPVSTKPLDPTIVWAPARAADKEKVAHKAKFKPSVKAEDTAKVDASVQTEDAITVVDNGLELNAEVLEFLDKANQCWILPRTVYRSMPDNKKLLEGLTFFPTFEAASSAVPGSLTTRSVPTDGEDISGKLVYFSASKKEE